MCQRPEVCVRANPRTKVARTMRMCLPCAMCMCLPCAMRITYRFRCRTPHCARAHPRRLVCTAGITYMMSMHSRYPGQPPIIIDNGENCYKFTKHSMRLEQFVTTTYLVRWPFSHAQSQYNMCTASAYARAELRPFHYGGAPLHNFSAWVDHYASLRQRPRRCDATRPRRSASVQTLKP
eukprot:357523-Chlamydomonas_euryale.AAC.1